MVEFLITNCNPHDKHIVRRLEDVFNAAGYVSFHPTVTSSVDDHHFQLKIDDFSRFHIKATYTIPLRVDHHRDYGRPHQTDCDSPLAIDEVQKLCELLMNNGFEIDFD